jgi:hypothetical protein
MGGAAMTPLAFELLEDLCGTFYLRWETAFAQWDYDKVRPWLWAVMQEVKFFECTAVLPLIHDLTRKMYMSYEEHDQVDQRLAFLPAPATWIEFNIAHFEELPDPTRNIDDFRKYSRWLSQGKPHSRYRIAWILIDHEVTKLADVFVIGYEQPVKDERRMWVLYQWDGLPLVHSNLKPRRVRKYYVPKPAPHDLELMCEEYDKPMASVMDFMQYATLALINSPRVIGRQLYYPHMRDEREKLKKLKLVGKFPLHAWTEILLRVATRPEDHSGEEPQEAHLTGDRCLHYCRSFLRVRNGLLEYVIGHWRGNPALGMRRSRYRLEKELPR